MKDLQRRFQRVFSPSPGQISSSTNLNSPGLYGFFLPVFLSRACSFYPIAVISEDTLHVYITWMSYGVKAVFVMRTTFKVSPRLLSTQVGASAKISVGPSKSVKRLHRI